MANTIRMSSKRVLYISLDNGSTREYVKNILTSAQGVFQETEQRCQHWGLSIVDQLLVEACVAYNSLAGSRRNTQGQVIIDHGCTFIVNM